MKATILSSALFGLAAIQASHGQLMLTEIQSNQSQSGAGDYWELTNFGTASVDLTGYKYTDSARTLASAVAIPDGTIILPGESIVFTGADIASFRAYWARMASGAKVVNPLTSAPGLGAGDGITLYDASGAEVFFFSYAAGGFTTTTGASSVGGHAGASAGGAATQALVWDPASGTASPRYTYATGANFGSFPASTGTDQGSPGTRGYAAGIDLSSYVRVGRYNLPEPTRTTAPAGNLLAQEASGVAYNWDTDTLFIVGDGGRSVTQVSKTGQLIDTMTLAAGSSPQGTAFYDPEGITYVGGGKFVMTEERDRQLVLFTYAGGTTLDRSGAQVVKLGTFVDNIGLEGLSYDPQTGGFVIVKEISPMGIFQTNVDFAAGTATNGSPTTVNSVNLFDPALTGLADFADVFALSNLPSLSGGPQAGNILVLSQESARIVNIDRSGVISSSLQIVSDPGNPLTVANQQHEGMTMDRAGNLYVVSENGGGDIDHPQLWVYAPSTVPNAAPTAIALANVVSSLPENTATASALKVADISVTDDGLGSNTLRVTGADAAFFTITGNSLYIKAGTVLDFETKSTYSVTVEVDDTTVGTTPDASVPYTLTLTDVVNETPVAAGLIISEVAPWSSGNSPVSADWFEVTNTGTAAVDITGWKMDDNSNAFASAVALTGITSIAPGESVIFLEASAANRDAVIASFKTTWFGANPPASLQIGSYTGSGVGLSTGGDAVNLFDSAGNLVANVAFGASPSAAPYATFDNAAGLNNATISRLSRKGVYGAAVAAGDTAEIGSPGNTGKLFISEVAPWGSGSTPYSADWFEVTNPGARPVDITGWKIDDNSNSFAAALPLNGVTTIAPGESVIFIETATSGDLPAKAASFLSTWFGASPPAGLQIGSYSGGGAGLSTGGDAVNLFDASGNRVTGVSFGASTSGPFASFENSARLGSDTLPLPVLTGLSAVGTRGAITASADSAEIGSPGTTGKLIITEVAPWGSSASYGADWFEVTNTSSVAVDMTGWKMDDLSESPAAAVALTGIPSIAPGESVVYLETATPETTIPAFRTAWFGATPPVGLQIGAYSGSGVGLSSGGDAVNLYTPAGVRAAHVAFGASTNLVSFDNSIGIEPGNITALSVPARAGAFTAASDGAVGSPGAMANAGPLNVNSWLAAYGLNASTPDSDGDGIDNLQEFAFGLDPRTPNSAGLVVDVPNGQFTSRGTPVPYAQATPNGQDFRVVFVRRKDAASAGLTYTPEFSSDLSTWQPGTVTPTVIASDAEVEVVSLPYPFFVNGRKAQYFRVTVTGP